VIWVGYNGVAWHDLSCGAMSGDGANIARTSYFPLYRINYQIGIGQALSRAYRVLHSVSVSANYPIYCDVIIRRWEEFTGDTAVLVTDDLMSSGKPRRSMKPMG